MSEQHGQHHETFRSAISLRNTATAAIQQARRHLRSLRRLTHHFALSIVTFVSLITPRHNRPPILIANMASTTVINANATSKPQPSTAPPIEPLKNDTARLYTHIHPILVLSVYAFKFPALVADPVPTLLSTLAPLAVLQIAFVAVCLPPTGGTPNMRNKKPGEKKGKAPGKLEQGLNSKIVVRIPSGVDAAHHPYGARNGKREY
jgi:hypothetical protein